MAITLIAMKTYSRAYNRQQKEVKFKKRVNKWFASHWKMDPEEVNKALTGTGYTFLRTTGRPCNCYGCTYEKHKRTPKHKVMRDALKE